MLSKENFSNGCIGTVDVTYPAAPLFLLFNVELLKAQVTPILDYGKSPRWKFPFAPHDLGQYPLANGQVYGGGEQTEKDQMPVEECGNMLLLVAAICRADGNAEYAKTYWPLLTRWAEYLEDKGLDPENQLCTDDFAGHLAHNTNLSLKAIVAIGGYSQMCQALGKNDEAASFRTSAKEMTTRWIKMAKDGDHYRLAFDKPGTWSQKYNLVWDKLLGLDLFPSDVARTEEVGYYSQEPRQEYRPAARQSQPLHQARLARLDRDDERLASGFRGTDRAPDPLRRGLAEPGADDGLVLDPGRQAEGLPGPIGRRRRVHQDARRPRLDEALEAVSSSARDHVPQSHLRIGTTSPASVNRPTRNRADVWWPRNTRNAGRARLR